MSLAHLHSWNQKFFCRSEGIPRTSKQDSRDVEGIVLLGIKLHRKLWEHWNLLICLITMFSEAFVEGAIASRSL